MMFASDNMGPAAPEIMAAVQRANQGHHMPYGADRFTDGAVQKLRDLFEAPQAAVHLISTGTAANAVALAALANPWDAIFVHPIAHAEEDECGAPEFYSGGAKLTLVDGADGKMDPDALREAILLTADREVRGVQCGPVSITNITEIGTIYSLEEIRAITDLAKSFGLKTHLDGARLANACAALNCTPAEMSWKAGIDAVSFGGTKNGCIGVEAIIFFDAAKSWELELRRKRGGHLSSKFRFLSAQMEAYASDGLWLRLAQAANARCAELVAGLRDLPGASIEADPAGNMVFAHLPRAAHRRAMAAGAQYYLYPADSSLDGPDDALIRCRFVCDWSCTPDSVQTLLAHFRG
jgi:threonine aldolase